MIRQRESAFGLRWARHATVVPVVAAVALLLATAAARPVPASAASYVVKITRGPFDITECTLRTQHSSGLGVGVSWGASGACEAPLDFVLLRSSLWDASGVLFQVADTPTYVCDVSAGCGTQGYSVSGEAHPGLGSYTIKTIFWLSCGAHCNDVVPVPDPLDPGSPPAVPACVTTGPQMQCTIFEHEPLVVG
jgi:hypothetical protein